MRSEYSLFFFLLISICRQTMCVWGPASSIDLSEYFIFFSNLIFLTQSSVQIMIFNNNNKMLSWDGVLLNNYSIKHWQYDQHKLKPSNVYCLKELYTQGHCCVETYNAAAECLWNFIAPKCLHNRGNLRQAWEVNVVTWLFCSNVHVSLNSALLLLWT